MKITPIRLKRINAEVDMDKAIKALSISKSAFYKIEQGHLKPSRELLKKMSNLYKCSMDEIFNAVEQTSKGAN